MTTTDTATKADTSKPSKPGNVWTPGMASPNPAGRPKGVRNKVPQQVAHMVDTVLQLAGDANPEVLKLPDGREVTLTGGEAYLYRMANSRTASERGKFQELLRARMPKHLEVDVGETLESLLGQAHAARVADAAAPAIRDAVVREVLADDNDDDDDDDGQAEADPGGEADGGEPAPGAGDQP